MLVQNLLSDKAQRIISVAPDNSIAEAAQLLTTERIGAVLVRDAGGALVGILSERDIVARLATAGGACLDMSVDNLMTREVITCTPEDAINVIMEMMTAHRIRHVPVLHDNILVGVVSIGDVVKNRLAEVESEAQSLREYIATA